MFNNELHAIYIANLFIYTVYYLNFTDSSKLATINVTVTQYTRESSKTQAQGVSGPKMSGAILCEPLKKMGTHMRSGGDKSK